MSKSFSYDLSVAGSPSEAQARLREVVTQQLRQSAKMHLTSEDSNSLAFRPQWGFPLVATVARLIRGEGVKLSFSAGDGGTLVAVSGKVGAERVASREFWAETLGAT